MYLSMYKCVPVIVDVCFFRVRGNFALLAKKNPKKTQLAENNHLAEKKKKNFP